MSEQTSFEVLVVGAGPAGIAAACCAAEAGVRVGVADDNPAPGGQIWRADARLSPDKDAARWLERLRRAGVPVLAGVQIVDAPQTGVLIAQKNGDRLQLAFQKLIVATGARELFLPFPGWTLPNVTGAGGLQAMVKAGLPIKGKRVAVAGSGPLLLEVAAYLRRRGARVVLIAEQAPWRKVVRFGFGLRTAPAELVQATRLKLELAGIRYATGCWPVRADGGDTLAGVSFRSGEKTWREACDYLACGFGLVPNVELPLLLGCATHGGAIRVDEWQQTTVAGIYCAGETAGVGGLDLSLAEGRIAGYAAGGHDEQARAYFTAREKARGFARTLAQAFALRDELKALPAGDTIVCRCEDVVLGKLKAHDSWREAKLQTRCGMGSCQGRICGPATEFLLGWGVQSTRPPIFPAKVATLAGTCRPESSS